MRYKRGDRQINLPCKHVYHTKCGSKWLSINKVKAFSSCNHYHIHCFLLIYLLLLLFCFLAADSTLFFFFFRHALFAMSKYLVMSHDINTSSGEYKGIQTKRVLSSIVYFPFLFTPPSWIQNSLYESKLFLRSSFTWFSFVEPLAFFLLL